VKSNSSGFSAYFIVRTSRVYSQFAGNFMKTMLHIAERDSLSVVYDQIGTPTHAVDLAHALVNKLSSNNPNHQAHGLYHYSNEGSCSRFEYAQNFSK
jgi:dTDP-4-dehydrorhamnose reductase